MIRCRDLDSFLSSVSFPHPENETGRDVEEKRGGKRKKKLTVPPTRLTV